MVCVAGLAGAGMLTGCVAVGYSSRGGWFMWPGGFGLLLVLGILFWLLRGRR